MLLVCMYGLLLFIAGALVSLVSLRGTEEFNKKIMDNVKKSDVEWVNKQNKLFMVSIVANDNDAIFALNSLMMGIWNMFLFYIGTVIMGGYTDGYCFLLGGIVAIVNVIALFLYMRA